MRILGMFIPAGLVLGSVIAQTPPARLEFEVVSVKPTEKLLPGQPSTPGRREDGAQVHLKDYSLRSFITMAYDLKRYQVIGPDWLSSQRFDLDATLPAGTNRTQIPAMLQSFLADRFGMKVHNDYEGVPGLCLGGCGRRSEAYGFDQSR
jgi:uncharacterized protein (TIGR03435 family)